MQTSPVLLGDTWFLYLLFLSLATMPIKGLALWKASRLSQKLWFIILLVVNTIGILDLIYIFFVARKYKIETKEEIPSQ